jgi:hypothetical protein
MVLLEARVVDATHLELSRPIGTRRGRKVFVSVAESGERDLERQEWLAASAERLGAAYSDSEPDYTPSMLREGNPDYGA